MRTHVAARATRFRVRLPERRSLYPTFWQCESTLSAQEGSAWESARGGPAATGATGLIEVSRRVFASKDATAGKRQAGNGWAAEAPLHRMAQKCKTCSTACARRANMNSRGARNKSQFGTDRFTGARREHPEVLDPPRGESRRRGFPFVLLQTLRTCCKMNFARGQYRGA